MEKEKKTLWGMGGESLFSGEGSRASNKAGAFLP